MTSLRTVLLVLLAACSGTAPIPDAGSTPKLSGLPSCSTPADAGTASDLYQSIVIPFGCGSGGCHGGTPPNLFEIPDGPGFRSAMLMKSAQVPALDRVKPGDIHASYVMYKLVGQHQDAGYAGSGDRMPQGGPYLDDAQLCAVISWINAGAP